MSKRHRVFTENYTIFFFQMKWKPKTYAEFEFERV